MKKIKFLTALLIMFLVITSVQALPFTYQKKFYKTDFKIPKGSTIALSGFLFQESATWSFIGYEYTYTFPSAPKSKEVITAILKGDKEFVKLDISMDTTSVSQTNYLKTYPYLLDFANFINFYKLPLGLFGKRSKAIVAISQEVKSDYYFVAHFKYIINGYFIESEIIGKVYDKDGNLLYNRKIKTINRSPKENNAEEFTVHILSDFIILNQQFWKEIVK